MSAAKNHLKKYQISTETRIAYRLCQQSLESLPSLEKLTDALGKVCGVDIRVDESIKTRIVTIYLSNCTILAALKAIDELDGPQKVLSQL